MAEENKVPETPPAAEAVAKPAEPTQAPAAQAPAAETPAAAPAAASAGAPEGAEAKKAAPKQETPANCCVCNKLIKKIRWYYRDGKFYCTKRCWMTAKKKDAAKAAEGQAAEQK